MVCDVVVYQQKPLTFASRDVAAGICILQEAGGLVTTANPPEDIEGARIEDVRLGSRLYLAVR
jgi:myo-inositol-1(or 4)-monophosphatase